MGSNMNTRNGYHNDMDLENLESTLRNDSMAEELENEDLDLLDEEDELEERYVPNMRKAVKRQNAAILNKKNKWQIKN